MEIKLSVKKLASFIITAAIVLIVINILMQLVRYFTPHEHLFGLIDRFDVDNEISVPTWFSQTQILLNSFLLAIIAWQKRTNRQPFYKHWTILSIIFLYLSIDEGAMLHEMLIEPFKHLLGAIPSYLNFTWVIPFSFLLIIFLAAYIPFLKNLSSKFRTLFLVSGFTYILGALGFEMIGSKILSLDLPNIYYLSSVCIEELLEMTGDGFFLLHSYPLHSRQF